MDTQIRAFGHILILWVLRAVFMSATWALSFVGTRSFPRIAFKWLFHYLKGSGTTLQVPEWAVSEAMEGIARALYNGANTSGEYGIHSSLDYPGRGFEKRPALFYLVGGFSFKMDETGVISGQDVYDWHPPGDDNQWYTSPMPLWVVRGLSAVFGTAYFLISGFPTGAPGISNRLWADMEKVGAKPFVSAIQYAPTEEEWERVDALHHEWSDFD